MWLFEKTTAIRRACMCHEFFYVVHVSQAFEQKILEQPNIVSLLDVERHLAKLAEQLVAAVVNQGLFILWRCGHVLEG